jgi:hypothetical protein
LRPAPRQKARSVASAATTATTRTTAPRAKAKRAARKTRHKHKRSRPTLDPGLSTSVAEIETRPAAQTTTTTAPGTSSANGGKGSYWPFIFAVIIGAVMLAGIRLAWRRG